MPVTDPNMPEPLKQAIETMEREVQSFKTDLSYQAPEMHRELWINLQGNLVDNLVMLYNGVSPEPYKTH
jgi:hypothetical protein